MKLPPVTPKCIGPLLSLRVLVGRTRSRGRILRSKFVGWSVRQFLEIREIISSMFGICTFLLIVVSFNFCESRAIFTDLSFLIVMTAGLTKQFSSMFFAFSMWPCFFSFSIFFLPRVVGEWGWVSLFVGLVSILLLVGCRLLHFLPYGFLYKVCGTYL